MFENKTILIISPEKWGLNFVSKHHYALELAKRQNYIYFLEPASKEGVGIKAVSNPETEKNIHLINFNPKIRGLNYLPFFISRMISKNQIKRIKREIGVSIDIVWSFDPYRFQCLKDFNAMLSIYHSVDVHKTKLEFKCVQFADVVLATSNLILEKFKKKNKPKYVINHGLASHFVRKERIAKKHSGKIKVGYVGNLFYPYLACDILEEIIKFNLEHEFHFIGPYEKSNLSSKEKNLQFIEFVKRQDNCVLHGSVASLKLPKSLEELDLFLMCYKSDEFKAELANPHKILEYLSTGKVVVSHYIDEYNGKRDLIQMADSLRELPKIFKETINRLDYHNSIEKQMLRRQFALENTYTKQINKIQDIILKNGIGKF